MYNGEDLLSINESTLAKYGLKIDFKMWTTQELVEQMISTKNNLGSHCRPAIDDIRNVIWEGIASNILPNFALRLSTELIYMLVKT